MHQLQGGCRQQPEEGHVLGFRRTGDFKLSAAKFWKSGRLPVMTHIEDEIVSTGPENEAMNPGGQESGNSSHVCEGSRRDKWVLGKEFLEQSECDCANATEDNGYNNLWGFPRVYTPAYSHAYHERDNGSS